LAAVGKDEAGNVYACLPGKGVAPPLVISAHLDTVFPEPTSLEITHGSERICGPGIGDNSVGIAGLLGLTWALRSKGESLPGDVWLVANVGEEGLGDLCGMRAVVERFQNEPLAYIALEGMALGQIYNRGLGVRRYRITALTRGGHSWVDYGAPSAVHELISLAYRLTAMKLPGYPRTTMNIGVISGGTSVNTIAAEAHLELDLRSEDLAMLDQLTDQVESLVAGYNRTGVQVECQIIGNRPVGAISPHHPLVQTARRSLEKVGLEPRLHIGSTDANIPLSLGLPAICVGITTGGGAHTLDEYIHVQPVAQGITQLYSLVKGAYT
jgi:acetylornithine deacetylase/succinyl-diaminopimelate desuccinylase-like protein